MFTRRARPAVPPAAPATDAAAAIAEAESLERQLREMAVQIEQFAALLADVVPEGGEPDAA